MNEELEFRILLPGNKEQVFALAKELLARRVSEPMEREMQSWSAPWRAEALDHYLSLGWSFGAFQKNELRGFVLGQPFVFFRSLTQTLWIESLEAVDDPTARAVLDCATRWARDKHFQCVVREEKGQFTETKTARY